MAIHGSSLSRYVTGSCAPPTGRLIGYVISPFFEITITPHDFPLFSVSVNCPFAMTVLVLKSTNKLHMIGFRMCMLTVELQ